MMSEGKKKKVMRDRWKRQAYNWASMTECIEAKREMGIRIPEGHTVGSYEWKAWKGSHQ